MEKKSYVRVPHYKLAYQDAKNWSYWHRDVEEFDSIAELVKARADVLEKLVNRNVRFEVRYECKEQQ